ncbi:MULTISPECIES: metallophosphoesterase family protein [unclassified Bradyrhizobium]|uniref:metallophosphoesterase family protein n=1 Tax=unclassified Bradyrhizobium TaxID=2631580 RepID=UPI0028ED408A|nr:MULTISPECIES: metallophosphoesterase family protein [unclassified Bradyrhizobium]
MPALGSRRRLALASISLVALAFASPALATTVTYAPYIQPGDLGPLGNRDQVVIAWQTDETAPNPSAYKVEFAAAPQQFAAVQPQARVVDNYLAADRALPVPPGAYGAHSNYTAVLRNLKPNTTYTYRVTGPGLPAGGFQAQFQTRKTGNKFSFTVMGDEGFFPAQANSSMLTDYFARIVHLMYNSGKIALPGEPARPAGEFALNTGDNVYNTGSEQSYRDYWMPVWNSDVDSVDRGAPFIRSMQNYIVAGNHDIGGSGDYVNLLATTTSAARYQGQTGGGDALAYYNLYYFPLNGPTGVDPAYVLNGDTNASDMTGFKFAYNGTNYSSPAAAEAFRASTAVDTGQGMKRQIDHMGNFSFDYGNAHFVFLDSNPHLFNALVDYAAIYAKAPSAFPAYPKILRDWLIKDLDSSDKTWKIVVYHHPAFSSGHATLRNNQMRQITKLLEDHGVNVVFNGHEHNYQRTRPLRAGATVAAVPTSTGPEAVSVDTVFDGVKRRVPDGVLHVVEGAGGNRDFDGDEDSPRGSGRGLDQEDSATGSVVLGDGNSYPQGQASWLDTHLTNAEMSPFIAGAGKGAKITVNFKAKVFSFGHVVVDGNRLTHYQISEPLLATSSASTALPAPYGRDYYGNPVKDPVPDTVVDPATGKVVTPSQDGPSVLLDKWTIEKPDLDDKVTVRLVYQNSGLKLKVKNRSQYALNGAQLVLEAGSYSGPIDDTHNVIGDELVVTLGRIAAGDSATLDLPTESRHIHGKLRSATAQPIEVDCDRNRDRDYDYDSIRDRVEDQIRELLGNYERD